MKLQIDNVVNVFQDVYDDRSGKMVEVMDKCEKSIAEVIFIEWNASLHQKIKYIASKSIHP